MNTEHGSTTGGSGTSIQEAIRRHRGGDLDGAERCYRALLETNPDDPDALHFFGVLLHGRGEHQAALEAIDRSLSLVPDYTDARNNRGNILKKTGRTEEAERDYRDVLEQSPGHPSATRNLARMLQANGQARDALDLYRETLEHRPNDPGMLVDTAWLLWNMQQEEPALDLLQRALAVRPDFDDAYLRMAAILGAAGRREAAVPIFREWLEREPDNPVARHMLTAIEGNDTPERATEEFVSSFFDEYAESFNENLEALDYRGPSLIRDALLRHRGSERPLASLCDLGCGTGLCGELLHEHTTRLDGVDLSHGMLVEAARTGAYQQLYQADLVRFLEQVTVPYEALVSGDTLIYLGDLRPTLEAALGAVVDGGLFIFSLERIPDTLDAPYHLDAGGRYSHSRNHVEALLADVGWSVVEIAEDALRVEVGKPVAGLVVTACKAS